MRILIFSLAPIFAEAVHGGSQRILAAIAKHLGERGNDVTILCTQRPDLPEHFEIYNRVTVKPILQFKPIYPEPYYTAPYNLAGIITTIAAELGRHDRFYIHDSELAYQFLCEGIPTVWSFRDFVYPDTLACGLSFQRDRLILSSQYLEQCVLGTMGRYFPDIGSRVVMIPNGIDLDYFNPIRTLRPPFLNVDPDAFVMLCPHRPDPKKGLEYAVQLLARISSHSTFRNRPPYLFIPQWIDSRIAESQPHYYQDAYHHLAALAATEFSAL